MYKQIQIIIILFYCVNCEYRWTWLSGNYSSNVIGTFGSKGTPSIDVNPGGLNRPLGSFSPDGTFWLFGGSDSLGSYNTLWRYNGTWTWISGNNSVDDPGYYGIRGLSSPNNQPSSRSGACGGFDFEGTFWVFGGSSTSGVLNDLWKFSYGRWTWKGGSNITQGSSFGIKGQASSNNYPGSRSSAAAAFDRAGYLWIFGGFGPGGDIFNDLWRYSSTNNLWTWMSGDSTPNSVSIFGRLGIPDDFTFPGARYGAVAGFDSIDCFWIFGGKYSALANLNDLWKFCNGKWTWVGGTASQNVIPVYGTKNQPSPTSYPGAGSHLVGGINPIDNSFWVFGGNVMAYSDGYLKTREFSNDLWRFNNGNWTWVSGDINRLKGIYGPKGVSSADYFPSGRAWSTGGFDKSGNFMIFGGQGYSSDYGGLLNDLWMFSSYTPPQSSSSNTPSTSFLSTESSAPLISSVPTVLSISSESSEANNLAAIIGGVGGGVFVIFIVIIAIVIVVYRRKKSEKEKATEIQNKLGSGQFGEVYKGLWQETTTVALKKPKFGEALEEFQREINTLTSLRHPNCVQFLGTYTSLNKEVFIVTEFMDGNVLDLVRKEDNNISVIELIGMAKDAAAGTYYLHGQNILHRDLALRNLLVKISGKDGRDFLVKVADFGLARKLNGNEYLKQFEDMIPVKWYPPEALQMGKFSSAGDCWSFGIVLYELFSYGKIPYPGKSGEEVLNFITSGSRLDCPPNCPEEVYKLMLQCWNVEPKQRPSLREVYRQLKQIMETMKGNVGNYQTLNPSSNSSYQKTPPTVN